MSIPRTIRIGFFVWIFGLTSLTLILNAFAQPGGRTGGAAPSLGTPTGTQGAASSAGSASRGQELDLGLRVNQGLLNPGNLGLDSSANPNLNLGGRSRGGPQVRQDAPALVGSDPSLATQGPALFAPSEGRNQRQLTGTAPRPGIGSKSETGWEEAEPEIGQSGKDMGMTGAGGGPTSYQAGQQLADDLDKAKGKGGAADEVLRLGYERQKQGLGVLGVNEVDLPEVKPGSPLSNFYTYLKNAQEDNPRAHELLQKALQELKDVSGSSMGKSEAIRAEIREARSFLFQVIEARTSPPTRGVASYEQPHDVISQLAQGALEKAASGDMQGAKRYLRYLDEGWNPLLKLIGRFHVDVKGLLARAQLLEQEQNSARKRGQSLDASIIPRASYNGKSIEYINDFPQFASVQAVPTLQLNLLAGFSNLMAYLRGIMPGMSPIDPIRSSDEFSFNFPGLSVPGDRNYRRLYGRLRTSGHSMWQTFRILARTARADALDFWSAVKQWFKAVWNWRAPSARGAKEMNIIVPSASELPESRSFVMPAPAHFPFALAP